MKILLARPPVESFKRLNAVPPIGLGYLSSVLKKNGFETNIIDCAVRAYNLKQFVEIFKEKQPEVLGFQVFSQDVKSVNESARIVKEISPSTIIIAGGAHPSGVKGGIFEHMPYIDFAFQGEAEIGLPQLIGLLKSKKFLSAITAEELETIPGLIWKKDGHAHVNPAAFVKNLDSLDFPDWQEINPQTYPNAPQGIIFKSLPVAPIMATRGCPFPCTFCAGHTISGKIIRKRSIENVISEIQFLRDRYGVREIHILDDNFSFHSDYIKDFCNSLIESKLNINWCCPNGLRLDTLTKDLVTLMKKSGCYYISLGIESGNNDILKDMKKLITLEQIKKQVEIIKSCGMDVNGFFIIGYPGETEKTIRKTIDFAKSLPLSRAAFYNFLPLPDTEICKTLIQKGLMKEMNYNKFFQGDVPYVAAGLSAEKIKKWQRRANREFYLRPRTFFSLLSNIKSFSQLLYIVKRARVYF